MRLPAVRKLCFVCKVLFIVLLLDVQNLSLSIMLGRLPTATQVLSLLFRYNGLFFRLTIMFTKIPALRVKP